MEYAMTWKQFKDAVEAQGVKDTDKISWIDIHGDCDPEVGRYGGQGNFTVADGDSRDPIDRGEDGSDSG